MIISIFLYGCYDPQVDQLGMAATGGNIDKVKQLVKAGVNVNGCIGYEGCDTPLDRAASYGHLEIVEYLVEHGAIINNKKKPGNAVYLAASLGKFDVVDYLLSKRGRLICDEASLDRLKEILIKTQKIELGVKLERTWLPP